MSEQPQSPQEFLGSIRFDAKLVSPERAEGSMSINTGILNPFGTVHAGALIWFADVVATMLAFQGGQASEGATGFPLAINLNANLLSNAQSGELRAIARFVKRGRRVSTVRTTVETETGRGLIDVTTTHIAAE